MAPASAADLIDNLRALVWGLRGSLSDDDITWLRQVMYSKRARGKCNHFAVNQDGLAVASNENRSYLLLVNNSPNQVRFAFGQRADANVGILLAPNNGSFREAQWLPTNDVYIQGVTGSGGSVICVEGSDL